MSEKVAWGYVRLSQEGRDLSLEKQKADIREYAKEHDLDLQTTRNDGENTSGFDKTREGYQLLREKIRNSEIDAVIVRDRARLSRDFDDRLQLKAVWSFM
jgi:DNA invertase Pin-like site-specific DNA recombinase